MLGNSSSPFVKYFLPAILFLSLILGLAVPTQTIRAAGPTAIVYDAISDPLPPNMASVGFQATQTAEFGDYIHLAGTNRILRTVTVTMSDWALYSDYSADPRYSANSATWSHPITLNIYNVTPGTPLNHRGSLLASVTQTVAIPWRPAADPTCANPTQWKASNGTCYSGLASNITFDLGSLNVILPNNIIVGVAFNTQTYGAPPIGVNGPYNSLNIGVVGTTTVGTDDNTDNVFWNTSSAASYTDGGIGGVGIFREDTVWTPYGTVNIQITAAAAPEDVYVNSAWGSVLPGQDPDGSGPATHMGYDAFTTIQAGTNAVASSGTVHVAAGTFNEQVTINKSLHLLGAGIGSSIISAPGTLPASGLPTSAIILISGTGVNAELTGFTVTGPGPSGCGSIRAGIYVYANANANIHHNTIQDIRDNPFSGCQNGVAIAVGRQAWTTSGTATIDHNTIIGYQKGGIVVDNTGSNATITNNTITGAGTTAVTAQNGIQISRGANATLSGNTVTGNSFHLAASPWDWGASGILVFQAGAVTMAGGNTASGNDQNLYIDSATSVTLGAESFGPSSAPLNSGYDVINYTTLPLNLTSVTFPGTANNFEIEDLIWHGVDDPTKGLVTWVAGNLYVTPLSGTIQSAINVATAGDTINVAPGTYVENVIVNKTVTLVGSGTSTIVQPAISNPNCGGAGGGSLCAGGSYVFLVQANNVVIHDLTVDGDNPALASGIVVNGADLDARNGIITDHNLGVYNGLEVYNVTVKNIYLRGMYASSGGTFNFHNNTVTNVQANPSSIAMFAYGGGPGIMANNTVSYANDAISANHSKGIQFLNNVVTHSGSGIHTDNAGDGGGVADLIQGNTVSDCSTDGYGIFVFVPYLAPTINNNTITNCSVGLSAWGQGAAVTSQFTNNTVTGPAKAVGSVGAYITTDQIGYSYNDVSVLFTGNIITNFETGVYLTADAQTWTPGWISKTVNATFHLNQINGNTKGLDKGTTGTYITDFEKNWWGAVSGPGLVGLGSGDTVSANVDYSPWCINPVCSAFAPPFSTTTTITADLPDPSILGQTVSVTATVVGLPAGALTPTGTVVVFEGVASSSTSAQAVGTYCTITLVSGTGSCDMTFLSAGAKTITALYNPSNTADFTASSDTESHTIDKALSQVTTWPTASSINYGQTLAASILSGGVATPAGSFAFTTPATAPNAGTALQNVTFTPTDTVNYNPVTSTVSVTVNKVALSVTANNVSKTFDGLVYSGSYSVTYLGFVNSETAAILGGTLAYSGTSQSAINVGSYTIIPNGLTSGNYTITFNIGTLTINKAAQTITFGALADQVMGNADFNISASASSGLAVSFSTTTATVCTVTPGGLVHLVGAGTCAITANQNGNANYTAAAPVQQSFAIRNPQFILYLPIILR